MTTRHLRYSLLLILALASVISAQTTRHPFRIDDIFRFRDVRDPQLSPDGQWVAWRVDCRHERRQIGAHIWLIKIDAGMIDRLPSGQKAKALHAESDGKYLSFTSSRPGKACGSQVCARLSRRKDATHG